MTHRSPYARRPRDLRLAASIRSRDSRHAASRRPRQPSWLRIRPAVRLLAVATTAGACLCLCVIAVSVVAQITALPPAGPGTGPTPPRPTAALASMSTAWTSGGAGHSGQAQPAAVPPGRCPPLTGVRFWLGLDNKCAGQVPQQAAGLSPEPVPAGR
jgi:hypothetical protein